MLAALVTWGGLALRTSVAEAQRVPVLQLDPADALDGALPADRGGAGVRQRLLELGTFASVMQVTAHPDDEQAGLMTLLSRATGARTALLTLNRGEAGANAVGSELFDALGLLRTEELLLADRYYGLDDQYFTSAVDYGYSKTVAEAARSWDTTAVLRDMVRVIRANRPLVVISRWYGGDRDGHGHHQLAGVLTPLAVAAAADPRRFPEQLSSEGLQAWRVRRLLRANVRAGERADVVIDAGRYDPWLGTTYQSFGADGYARQRSQTAGRRSESVGVAPQRLQLLTGDSIPTDDALFAGMDVSLPAVFALTGERGASAAIAQLRDADAIVSRAMRAFTADAPWEIVALLASGLHAVRAALAETPEAAPCARALLEIKTRQFERAIVAALAVELTALAGPGTGDGHPVVPGERVTLHLTAIQGAPGTSELARVEVHVPPGWKGETAVVTNATLDARTPWRSDVQLDIPTSAEPSRPRFRRDGISEEQYRWRDGVPDHAPRDPDVARVRLTLRVDGEAVGLERAVRYRRAQAPDGITYPRLVVVPPVSVQARPAVQVVTTHGAARTRVTVEVTGFSLTPVRGEVQLTTSSGIAVTRAEPVTVSAGERRSLSFEVALPDGVDSLTLVAMTRVDGRIWRDAVTMIDHRELEPSYLYERPTVLLRRIPVSIASRIRVGYVMGVGDLVPEAIAQLGAEVTMLDAATVTTGDFASFDAVVIGTRAYAVRSELPAATAALTAYARDGGNVVVLYQTPEFHPETMAPFRAILPNDAEETTEQDAPVQLLDPAHPLMTTPNRITSSDFDGWIEQRGSKFLTELAPEYTSLVETHDTGQAPQRGIWVTADVGAGRWSYVALALHRQLPYGVPGAYRILANLLTRRSTTRR